MKFGGYILLFAVAGLLWFGWEAGKSVTDIRNVSAANESLVETNRRQSASLVAAAEAKAAGVAEVADLRQRAESAEDAARTARAAAAKARAEKPEPEPEECAADKGVRQP